MSTNSSCLKNVLTTPTKFCIQELFKPGESAIDALEKCRVLVVGAGGLGCEVLKNLALSGFKHIEIIDLDTIELSNLNRQFLFRESDIGKSKAQVAAEFIKRRRPLIDVKQHNTTIQSKLPTFYKSFDIVMAGLDNIEARRWLNSMIVDLIEYDDETGEAIPESVIPLIDGGTEGFKGQVRLFCSPFTSCYECSFRTMVPERNYALCTIRHRPRLPEHCIMFASQILWNQLKQYKSCEEQEFKPSINAILESEGKGGDEADTRSSSLSAAKVNQDIQLDTDNDDHMRWICERAKERASKFNIEGVDLSLTYQVVKNIIPALASTNALIAAVCVNEAFKLATQCSHQLNNYFMYMGQEGIYTRTFVYEKEEDCLVCGSKPLVFEVCSTSTLESLIQKLKDDQLTKLKDPSIQSESKIIFMSNPAMIENYRNNLSKLVSNLIEDKEELIVTDPTLGGNKRFIRIKIKFK